jgi:hypothetical protein
VKGVFGRSLATSYIDIPAVPEASVYVDMKGRVSVAPAAGSVPPPPAEEPKRQEESVLQVRCQKPCTVSVDHVRRPSSGSHSVTVHGLKPGPHRLDVEFVLGGGARQSIDVPPASEVFVYATEKELQVTNTRPLGK